MATEYFNDAWRIPNNKNQSLVSNYSMDFDGTSNYVDISDPTELTDNFTIAAWIYPTRVDDSYEMIYTQGDGTVPDYFAIRDSRLHVYITGIYETNLGFINADEWQHVAVTRTSGVLNLYKNGVEYNGSRPTQNGTVNNNSDGVIGKWYNSSHYFKGKIDQVCIFDYALPATGTNSIATLYGGGTAVTNPMSLSPKPVSYYQLGDQTASNDTTEPTPPVQSYLVPNNSLQDYVFDFDGTDDYIDLGTPSILGNSNIITLSAWFNPSIIVNTYGPFIGIREAGNTFPYQLGVSDTTKVRFIISESVGTFKFILGNDVLSINNWYHAVAVANGTDLRLYINGVLQNDIKTYNGTLVTPTSNILMGKQRAVSTAIFNGEMSNLALWNTALTGPQVTTLYNNGAPNDISSLSPTAWYKLNAADTFDGTNWTITDYAGSNDGTSSGMTSANLIQSNLQYTSGYSPYALSLDSNDANYFTLNNGSGNGLLNAATSFTISAWINPNQPQPTSFGNIFTHFIGGVMLRFNSSGTIQLYVTKEDGSFPSTTATSALTFSNNWQHVVATYDGSFLRIYVNNVLVNTPFAFSDTLKNDTSSAPDIIGNRINTTQYFDGEISNVAVWKNSVIDVNTLYNQGVPADLTSLNPSGWWQMGSNSSFDANTSKWTCLNEGTARTSTVPSNATTFAGNMTNDDIVNGVGYSGNGLGTSSIEIVGDAPYSTANGISENMDVLDRTTDVPG